MALKYWPVLLFLIAGFHSSFSLRCYSCDQVKDPWCKYLQIASEDGTQITCSGSITECYQTVSADGGIISRGCLDPEIVTCDAAECERCSSDLCNSDQLAFDECASCDSGLDPNCKTTSSLTPIVKCVQTIFDKVGCYLQSDSWDAARVRRGCASQLNEEEFTLCSQNGDTCKICHGDSCNLKDTFQRCIVCDSEDDLECLQRKTDVSFDKFKKICTQYDDSCAAYVIPGGKTVRGCLKEANPEPTFCPSTNCNICPGTDCNFGLVPAGRARCYQCTSKSDASCLSNQLDEARTVDVCPDFYYDDECYRYFDEEADIGYRGCIRNSPEVEANCALYPERCSKCTTAACNSENIKQAPTLSCFNCINDVDCPWYFSTNSEGHKCESLVPFYKTEQCFSHKYSNNTVERGCLLDKPEVCSDPSECTICNREKCNNREYEGQSCIQCSSNDDGAYSFWCEKQAERIPGMMCYQVMYQNRGCYAFRDKNGQVIRGCHDGWPFCETEYKDSCTKCLGQDCNLMDPGAGFATKASAIIISTVVGVSLIINDVL